MPGTVSRRSPAATQDKWIREPLVRWDVSGKRIKTIRYRGYIKMKEEKKAGFTQKWIEDAVKKLLQKEDIYESDMEQIKYLRIGD